MLPKTNLKNLVLRIKQDERLFIDHPENAEIIRKHMDKQKEYIIQCVMENVNNPLLRKIEIGISYRK